MKHSFSFEYNLQICVFSSRVAQVSKQYISVSYIHMRMNISITLQRVDWVRKTAQSAT